MWAAFAGVLVGAFLGVLFCNLAYAAPLSLHAHQANLYGGKMAVARACVDLNVRKPEWAVLYVNGVGGGSGTIRGWEQWKADVRHYRLKPGHRHFCRAFFPRHLEFVTVPARPGLPRSQWDHYIETPVQSVYASLHIGQRLFEAEAATLPGAVTFFRSSAG